MVSVTWLEGFDPSYVFKSKLEFKGWLLSHIDVTYLPPYLSDEKLEKFIKKALDYGFKEVCIPITSLSKAKEILNGKDLKLITFISSFHGNRNLIEEKAQACNNAISLGAAEIEFSPNLSLITNNESEFQAEIKQLIDLVRHSNLISKVYLEIDKLPDDLITKAVKISQECLPDYISIFIKLLEEETYDGENLNLSKEWFEKVDSALIKEKRSGLKVYGRIDSFNTLLPILFLATKHGWALENLRIGTEYGFEILDGLDTSDY